MKSVVIGEQFNCCFRLSLELVIDLDEHMSGFSLESRTRTRARGMKHPRKKLGFTRVREQQNGFCTSSVGMRSALFKRLTCIALL